MLLLSNRDSDNIKQKVVLDSNEGLLVFGKLMLQVLCLDTVNQNLLKHFNQISSWNC